MAYIGHHISAHLIGMLEFFRHFVEGEGKLPDFVATIGIDMHAHGVVAVSHRFGRVAHLAQGRGETSGEEVGDTQSHGKGDWHGDPYAQADFEQKPCHDECDGGGEGDKNAQFDFER